MVSETPLRLPVIDFSKPNLKPGSLEWGSVKSQVRKALEEFSCFEPLFDKVPVELWKSIFGALEALFDLPLQTKLWNLSKRPFHRYVGQYPQVPLYESIGIDDANIIEKVESMTNILWPKGNESFSKTIHSFSKQVSKLDQTIRRMILQSFNLEKDMDEHMNSILIYLGYNQILMHLNDQEKIAFITERGIYCYKVMSFGLKNFGATYQCLVNRMFASLLRDSMEVYIDDMVVKSLAPSQHLDHLRQVFEVL
ncbi:probable 2-oxoglutarate-dependent dioxygenase AOP1.2 [Pistacia vera]|uniref:probable 2-oxoglutarate-dependent dioxygenase AOP1.2 n=1 Tax=Pistacia vera TaxID=55513 RepID=UPI0012635583|nr:probable 2-oxoglutarate-dependent dioxygenase AOP1.2 [Pistacia vera]